MAGFVMSIFNSTGFAVNSGGTSSIQDLRMQESGIALHRVMEFTGCSIDDIINEPVAKFKVRHFYKVNRMVFRSMAAEEYKKLAKQEWESWIINL